MRRLLSLIVPGLLILLMSFLIVYASESPNTVVLSKLSFRGTCAGILVPAKYGDFSLRVSNGDLSLKVLSITATMVVVEYSKINEYYQLIALIRCPKPLVLRVLINIGEDEWSEEYWVYNLAGVPIRSTSEEVDRFLGLDYKCPNEEPGAPKEV